MKKVDLNVDIGEGFPHDEALLEFATSANVCCGQHAGSWDLTEQTVALCWKRGVRVGAHPGYPDRKSMGRRYPTPEESASWREILIKQVVAFKVQFAPAYFKPHGAWYNILARTSCRLKALPESVVSDADCIMVIGPLTGLPLMIRAGSFHDKMYRTLAREGLIPNFETRPEEAVITEGFADRRYLANGALVPRSEPNAVLKDPDEIQRQVLELAPKVQSICLHGDTPNCLQFAELVKKTLMDSGYEVGH